MQLDSNERSPVLFNAIKHHFAFILAWIEGKRGQAVKTTITEIQSIGHSVLDLYIGYISHTQVKEEIVRQLKNDCLFEYTSFKKAVDREDYFSLNISDGSTWILKEGHGQDKYIHIHPGRYSKYTIRNKATTLRSFIVAALSVNHIYDIDLKTINCSREKYLNLPPIQKSDGNSGVGRLIKLTTCLH
ncbi:MAG: hypothetical protein R3345_12040 [Fulvivirga sp.]|nr:hypothetical protein [Fulvivirga sp.]